MEAIATIAYTLGTLLLLAVPPMVWIVVVDLKDEHARNATGRRYRAWLKETE